MRRTRILQGEYWRWHGYPPCMPTVADPETLVLYVWWKVLGWRRSHLLVLPKGHLTRRLQGAAVGRPVAWRNGFCLRIRNHVLIVAR